MNHSAASCVEAQLLQDPSGVYARMDGASRALYRAHVRRIAASSRRTEALVARCAVACACAGLEGPARHVGFYLLDAGERALLRRLHALTPVARLRLLMRAPPRDCAARHTRPQAHGRRAHPDAGAATGRPAAQAGPAVQRPCTRAAPAQAKRRVDA